MKKLGKLNLQRLEQEMNVLASDEQNILSGGGQWVYFNGEPTYLLDEVVVEGIHGDAMTCGELWDLMASQGTIENYAGAVAGTFSQVLGAVIGANSIVSGMQNDSLRAAYERYCMDGQSSTDTLFIVQQQATTIPGHFTGSTTAIVNMVYNTNGAFLFSY